MTSLITPVRLVHPDLSDEENDPFGIGSERELEVKSTPSSSPPPVTTISGRGNPTYLRVLGNYRTRRGG